MGNIGPTEIILLLLLALLLFGAKRLPEIGRSLGTGMREFKDSVSGEGSFDDAQPVEVLPGGGARPRPRATPARDTDAHSVALDRGGSGDARQLERRGAE